MINSFLLMKVLHFLVCSSRLFLLAYRIQCIQGYGEKICLKRSEKSLIIFKMVVFITFEAVTSSALSKS